MKFFKKTSEPLPSVSEMTTTEFALLSVALRALSVAKEEEGDAEALIQMPLLQAGALAATYVEHISKKYDKAEIFIQLLDTQMKGSTHD